jgi:uncharacterized protein YwqG
LIQSFGQTGFALTQQPKIDTSIYCFTSEEVNFWIGAAYDSHTYLNAIDSMKAIQSRSQLKEQAMKFELKECQELSNMKDTLSAMQTKEAENLKSELKKERFFKSIWKSATGGIGILSAVVITYQAIKP